MDQNQQEIVIATSIAPVGLEKQQTAIQSWIKLGFKVISLNIQKEIDILQPVFQDVNFCLVERHAKDRYGKPFVYVSDVLKYLSKHGTPVCGIINSDILLRAGKNFAQFLFHEAKDSVIISSRIDIDEPTSECGEFYHYGFDLFFFDQKLLSHYPQSDVYCLGIPWWDYWIPLIAKQKSLNLKIMQNTVVYHVKHKMNYSIKNWREVGLSFTKQYDANIFDSLKKSLDSGQFEKLDKQLGDNVTYNLIQMFFKTSNLVTYDTEKYSDFKSEVIPKVEIQNPHSTVYNIEDKRLINTRLSDTLSELKQESEEQTFSKSYETLVFYSWHLYNSNDFKEMIKCLSESIKYQNDFVSLSQFILDWIDKFDDYSAQYNIEFDANKLSDLDEWKKLTAEMLSYNKLLISNKVLVH